MKRINDVIDYLKFNVCLYTFLKVVVITSGFIFIIGYLVHTLFMV
jgi:hypothetical protein